MHDRREFKTILGENLNAALSPATGLVCVVAIVVAVIGGPFGTFEAMSLSQRTVFWIVIILASVLVGYTVRALATLLVGHERPVLFDLAAILLMTLIFAPTVWVISQGFDKATGVDVPPLGWIYIYVFVMAFGVFVVRRLIPGVEPYNYPFLQDEAGSLPAEAELMEPRLMRRLSPEYRGTVLRISAQDHHVEIATSEGTESLRMRLTDAISEMEPVEGYCSHRSHWVARAAIAQVDRENAQKTWLVLTNGDRVPVSRKYRPGLEEAGIL